MSKAVYSSVLVALWLSTGVPLSGQTSGSTKSSSPSNSTALRMAEEEAVRRQEMVIRLKRNLEEAREAEFVKKNLVEAGRLYDQAFMLTEDIGKGVDPERIQAIEGISAIRMQLAVNARKAGDFREADDQVSRVLRVNPNYEAAQNFKRDNDKKLQAIKNQLPSREVEALIPEIQKERDSVATLVQDGRLLFEMGRLEEAEAKLKTAVEQDPENRAAFYYLSAIKEARYAQMTRIREEASKEGLIQVERAWIAPFTRDSLPTPNPYARTNTVYTGQGRQKIYEKLNKITINEIFFDGLPMSEVLKYLDDEARKRDPEGEGVNFIVNSHIDATQVGGGFTIDQFGNPVQTAAPDPIDLNNMNISIAPPLRNLRLIDIIDVISKAGETQMKFSVEDYAVVFTQKVPEPEQLFTRTFKVDPNTFMQGLESVSGISVGADLGQNGGGAGGGGGGGGGGAGGGQNGQNGGTALIPFVDVSGGGVGGQGGVGGGGGGGGQGGGQNGGGGGISNVTRTNLMANVQVMVRNFFIAAGVDFPATAVPGQDGGLGGGGLAGGGLAGGAFGAGGIAPGQSRKALFFNDRTGILFVRATMLDLDIIEGAIQVLNQAPPQVTIEAKFVEISQRDNKAVGFDWFLGNTLINGGDIAAQGGTAPTMIGGPSRANPTGFFPATGGIPTVLPSSTDQSLTGGLRNTTSDASSIPAVGTITGILTDPQFRVVIRALEQRDGVDLLSAPRVTTLSGRQAQMTVRDQRTIVASLNTQLQGGGGGAVGAGAAAGGGAVGGAAQFQTTQLPTGPSLDVIPYVSADGFSVQMTLIPTIIEFLGYDDAGQFESQVQTAGNVAAAPITATTPLPRIRIRQVTTSAIVWDGQTIVLGGLISEDVRKQRDKVPVLGDIPLLGRLFRSEYAFNEKKNLVVFVTPTIIDPAGNRLHMPDNLPYDPNTIPPQSLEP